MTSPHYPMYNMTSCSSCSPTELLFLRFVARFIPTLDEINSSFFLSLFLFSLFLFSFLISFSLLHCSSSLAAAAAKEQEPTGLLHFSDSLMESWMLVSETHPPSPFDLPCMISFMDAAQPFL